MNDPNVPVTEPGPVSRLLPMITTVRRGYKSRLRLTTLKTVDPPAEVVSLTTSAFPIVGMFGIGRGFTCVALEAVYAAREVICMAFFTFPIFCKHVLFVFTLETGERKLGIKSSTALKL